MKRIFGRILLLAVLMAALTVPGAGAAGSDGKMPVLMYHDLTDDPDKTNSMTITG